VRRSAARALAALACVAALAAALPPQVLAAPATAAPPRAAPPGGRVAGSAHAVLLADRSTTLSSRIAATVARVQVREGGRFAAGAVLVELECSELDALLRQARARVTARKATVDAQRQLARLNAGTPVELAQAEGALTEAEADRDLRTQQRGQCVLRAPWAGAVVRVHARAHAQVQAGERLVEIVSNDRMHAEIVVPSRWLSALKPGVPFEIRVDELGIAVAGRIESVVPRIDPVNRTVVLRGVLNAHSPALISGMSGAARFPGCAICAGGR
jgi:RND family efflux transporter MFP subunit